MRRRWRRTEGRGGSHGTLPSGECNVRFSVRNRTNAALRSSPRGPALYRFYPFRKPEPMHTSSSPRKGQGSRREFTAGCSPVSNFPHDRNVSTTENRCW